jgi:hypothetical protein
LVIALAQGWTITAARGLGREYRSTVRDRMPVVQETIGLGFFGLRRWLPLPRWPRDFDPQWHREKAGMEVISNRAELDSLLDGLLRFAQQMQQKHGEFYPFAQAMTREGQVEAVATYSGDERPLSQHVIDDLISALRAGAVQKGYRAIGICSDVRVVPPHSTAKTDAVRVHLEQLGGEAVTVYLPYRKKLLGKIVYGELFASAAEPQVFATGGAEGSAH